DLVLDRLLAGQEDDGDGRPLRPLLELADQAVPVELGEPRVAQDQVGRGELDLGERVGAVFGRGDAVSGLLEADLKHPDAARVRVDQEELLFRHRTFARALVAPGEEWRSACKGSSSLQGRPLPVSGPTPARWRDPQGCRLLTPR